MKNIVSLFAALILLIADANAQTSTTNKGYATPTPGTKVNQWGTVLNDNFDIIDSNLGGTLSLSVAGSTNVTITPSQAENLIYNFTGVLTGNIVVFFPAQGGAYFIENNTTGAFTVTIEGVGGSSGVIVPQGNGLPIAVDNSTSPATVSMNLATAGANNNITSILGLTTPLSLAQGGTPVYAGGTTTGSANAQAVTVLPSNFTPTKGDLITAVAGFQNTGGASLTVNGGSTGTIAVSTLAGGPIALSGGEMVIGGAYIFEFDGTDYQLLNPSTQAPNSVFNGNLAKMNTDTTKCNNTGGSATPIDCTVAQMKTMLGYLGTFSVHEQDFTTAGSYTYTPTTNMVYAIVEMQGGGGGGGGAFTNTGNGGAGGGGGAGGYSEEVLSAASIGASQSGTVGASGTGGNTSGGNGGTGGTTTLGALMSALGGHGGTGATDSTVIAAGGVGGGASGGSLNTNGYPGGMGLIISSSVGFDGFGGQSFQGAGGAQIVTNAGSSSNGNAPSGASGAGGSGALDFSGGGHSGAPGSAGWVHIIEFTSQ